MIDRSIVGDVQYNAITITINAESIEREASSWMKLECYLDLKQNILPSNNKGGTDSPQSTLTMARMWKGKLLARG